MRDLSKGRPVQGAVGENGKSRINIFDHPLFVGLSTSESIRVIADAFHYPSIAEDKVCREPDCDVVIHYGTICDEHRRERHAQYERVAYANRGGKRKKKGAQQAAAVIDGAEVAIDIGEDGTAVREPAHEHHSSLPPLVQPKKVGAVVQLPLGVRVDEPAKKDAV